MKSIKIVQKFFGKKEAIGAASYQRAKAKKDKMVILKIETIDAYELFKINGWLKKSPFKKLGIPAPGQFMIIVHYNHNVVAAKNTSSLKKKIIKASKTKTAGKVFKIVRLNTAQQQQVKATGFVYTSNITVPAFKFRYRKTFSTGRIKYNSISFTPPTYCCQIAA